MNAVNPRKLLPLAALLAVIGMTASGSVQAAPCTVDYEPTEPDASMTHTGPCGFFENDPQGEDPIGPWTFLDKANVGSGTSAGNDPLTITSTSLVEDWLSGTWTLDLTGTGLSIDDDDFMFVMKDGTTGTTDGTKNATSFWFILNETLGLSCTSSTFCEGTWDMYGVGGTTKQLSYLSVYTTPGGEEPPPPPPPIEVPEPGGLALLGLGLAGLWAMRRKTTV